MWTAARVYRFKEVTLDRIDWILLYEQLKIGAAATYAKLKLRPGVTVCNLCDAPQLGTLCERCKKEKDCFGYGNMCCLCCELDAIEMNARFEGLD